MKQTTNSIVMIRPVAFRMNEQTAINNYYQKSSRRTSEISLNCKSEFDAFVEKLRAVGVHVTVIDDTIDPDTPDSIFQITGFHFMKMGTCISHVRRKQESRAS
jgi:hypothetical protein